MQIIDSHTHIDFDDFNTDRAAIIQRAIDIGVSDIIVSSTIAARWPLVKKVCDDYKHICHAAYGLHPMFIHQHRLDANHDDIETLKSCLQSNKAIAVGEIGLDYFIQEADLSHRKLQLELFINQLEIASELKLPVIIHARKSLDIVLKHIRQFPSLRGAIHSFSGSEQQAKQLIDLGFCLSFGGPITYNRASRLHKLVKMIPLNALLVETDSPDQADSSHHSQRNEPAFIINILDKMAEIKNLEVELIAYQTSKNAIELFNLEPT